MSTETIDKLATMLGGGAAELDATVRAADELSAAEGPIDEQSIRKLLLALSDQYPNIEIVDTILGRLEVEVAWVEALFRSAPPMSRSAPEILETRIARLLNAKDSRERLLALVRADTGSAASNTLVGVARHLAMNPRPRPGDSARAFLAELRE